MFSLRRLFRNSNFSHTYKVNVEFLSLGKIKGWVVDDKSELVDVRLVVGKKVISQAFINKERPDVCEKFNTKGNHGFELELPCKVESIKDYSQISLIALNATGKKMVECVDKNDQVNIYGQIKNILNNSLVGLFGNVDGLKSDGLIYGWCAWKDIKKTAVVWLQCEGFDPISLKCDNLRKGMDKLGYQNHSGFILDPNELDHKYSEKIIYFTFDKEGNYKLPQGDKLILPSINPIKYTGKNNHYQKILNNIDKSFIDVVDNDYFQKHKYLIKKYSDQDIIDIFRLCLLKPGNPSTQVLNLMLQSAFSDSYTKYSNKFEKVGNYIIRKIPEETKPIVYSFGVGQDITFDLEIVSKFNVPVYMYDPTPKVVDFMKRYSDNKNLIYKQQGIYDKETEIKLFHHKNPKKFNSSVYFSNGIESDNYTLVKCKTLDKFVKENNHKNIDILKMDVEGVADKVLIHMFKTTNIRPHQIVTEFEIIDIESPITYIPKLVEVFKLLELNGYKIFNQLLTRKPTIEMIFIDESLQWKE